MTAADSKRQRQAEQRRPLDLAAHNLELMAVHQQLDVGDISASSTIEPRSRACARERQHVAALGLASSPTGRNLEASGRVRLGIGPTRDVILVEGTVDAIPAAELPDEVGDASAAKTGFDPRRRAAPHRYFRIDPGRIQAWREANELEGRELMRDGEWLV